MLRGDHSKPCCLSSAVSICSLTERCDVVLHYLLFHILDRSGAKQDSGGRGSSHVAEQVGWGENAIAFCLNAYEMKGFYPRGFYSFLSSRCHWRIGSNKSTATSVSFAWLWNDSTSCGRLPTSSQKPAWAVMKCDVMSQWLLHPGPYELILGLLKSFHCTDVHV